ncbi:50S ribosomal protein L17 [Candidatus Gracilibacteria bacterium CG2_30_37_12]|nr:MAG: 50S ribosomal protein L17 [Candidatus Gracilibacteria bacterium CG2_30_37_12]
MRHRVRKNLHFKKKDVDHRNSMLRSLMTSLFTHKSLMTTEKRAEAVTPFIDTLINVVNSVESEQDKMNAIRRVGEYLFTKESSISLFEQVAPKYKGKTSGFTRITPIKYRTGDNAKLVKLELF